MSLQVLIDNREGSHYWGVADVEPTVIAFCVELLASPWPLTRTRRSTRRTSATPTPTPTPTIRTRQTGSYLRLTSRKSRRPTCMTRRLRRSIDRSSSLTSMKCVSAVSGLGSSAIGDNDGSSRKGIDANCALRT